MNIPFVEFQPSSSAVEAIDRSASILRSVGVNPTQIAIWLLRQHSKFDTSYSNVYDDACEIIEELISQPKSQQISEFPLATTTTTLTATQLGKMLAQQYSEIIYPPSAQQVNQALEQLSFHRRDSKKSWQLTKLGQQYGQMVNVTDKQERTRLQIKWFPTAIDRLAPLFGVSR